MDANDGIEVRKRGLKMIAIAIVVVVLVLFLMGAAEPEQGAYPVAVQPLVHAGWLGALLSFALGVFRTIVGAPGLGPFRMLRIPVAVLIGLFTVPIGLFGSIILHRAMSYDGDRTHDGEDVDFDWD
jgi:hypothetical protein